MKKTNWLNVTNRINSDRFQIPAGWETKDQVAESLQCDPKRVADLLKPGIESGHIERKQFPMWIEARRLVEQVVCYRENQAASGHVKRADCQKVPCNARRQGHNG